LSDLPSPAEAGFAKAGNRFPSPIGVEDKLFGIMRRPRVLLLPNLMTTRCNLVHWPRPGVTDR
jgi:hypothetical protein